MSRERKFLNIYINILYHQLRNIDVNHLLRNLSLGHRLVYQNHKISIDDLLAKINRYLYYLKIDSILEHTTEIYCTKKISLRKKGWKINRQAKEILGQLLTHFLHHIISK